MFAVIKTGGKQYRVQEGDVLRVEKIKAGDGQKVTFNQVLLIETGEKVLIGTPFLEKAVVQAEVLRNLKSEKIIVFKKKRRKQYKKKRGHRQQHVEVRIEKIISNTSLVTEAPQVEALPKVETVLAEKEKVEKPVPKEAKAKEEAKEVTGKIRLKKKITGAREKAEGKKAPKKRKTKATEKKE